MKNNFAMFCKTYRKDLNSFKRMINSFNKYNIKSIPMFVSVPELDLEIFKNFESDTVQFISDESYAKDYFVDLSDDISAFWGLTEGYVNQEICKLSFWENELAQNYLCIDSDLIFIRDFSIEDFMVDENTPYTVLVMDKDLSIEKHYQSFWNWRQNLIEKIYNEIELVDKRFRTCHGMQVLNSTVLKSLKNDFMESKGYSYKDLIKISPYEFTWYNAWFQKCKLIPEYAVEPFFKTFHMRIEYIVSRLKGLNLDDYQKAYVGIILNGNWKKTEKEYKPQALWMKIIYKYMKKV